MTADPPPKISRTSGIENILNIIPLPRSFLYFFRTPDFVLSLPRQFRFFRETVPQINVYILIRWANDSYASRFNVDRNIYIYINIYTCHLRHAETMPEVMKRHFVIVVVNFIEEVPQDW